MANDTLPAGDVEAAKRAEKTKRLFLDADGKASPRASTSSVAGRVIFVEDGRQLDFDVRDLQDKYPNVVRAAALFGIMTSVTNTVGKKGMTAEDMFTAASDRLQIIMEDGEWTSARESGPRSNDLILAAIRYYKDLGKDFDEEMQAKMRAKLNDEETGPTYRETLNANKPLMAALAAIRAERATELARKRASEAQNAPAAADLLDL